MDTFLAIADPTRRSIVMSLAQSERSFGELADQFEMSRPAVSQHLKVLRESGVVDVRPDAQRRIYSLSDNGLNEIDIWLNKVRDHWTPRLDTLELVAKGLKMELMLIPQEKLRLVRSLLDGKAVPGIGESMTETTALSDEPWAGLLEE